MRPLALLALLTAGCTSPSDADDKPADTGADADTDTDTDTDTDSADADHDGYAAPDDCDDADASIHPAAAESCNGTDDDCDGAIDEDASNAPTWYADADDDGYGDLAVTTVSCDPPDGYVADASDCDDADGAISPDGVEVCNGADDDCDTAIDDDPTGTPTWYADADGDGFGDPSVTAAACDAPAGYVADATDCDDASAADFPGNAEVCDGADNDCDGGADEDSAVDAPTWYPDADGDGYGDPSIGALACAQPSGYVADATDCDDAHAALTTVCPVAFDGTFGSAWETLESSPTLPWALQSFHPSGTLLHNFYPSVGQAYDPDTNTWSYLSTAAPTYRQWNQLAPWDGQLYGLFYGGIYAYDPSSDTWTTLGSYSGTDDSNMTESDLYGNIYGYTQDGDIVIYSAVDGSVQYVSTGLGDLYETRMAYDAMSGAIYFGAFYLPDLYRYDLATGAITTMTDIPESQLNDIFCSDRSGHIYAAGDSSGTTMWQYTTATDTWAALPDLPSDHGNNSTCTVSEDGWLYVGTDSYAFYRLALY